MTIASTELLGFALCAALIYNIGRSIAWRQFSLLTFSLVFLGSFVDDIRELLPLIAFAVLGYLFVALAQQNRLNRRAFAVVATVSCYVWLKKYGFFPQAALLSLDYTTIGLSYIFFRVLHLIIDAGEEGFPQVRPLTYLNYLFNFTSLVSGPIQGFPEFVEMQLAEQPLAIDIFVVGRAIERIVIGFFKVRVLSLALSTIQQNALESLSPLQSFGPRVMTGSIIAVAYPFYLYCNFSGYMDIVIGVARFLRLELPENFDRPFSAQSFIDFWNRWHITLSTWLKTYVFNPFLIFLMRRVTAKAWQPFLGVAAFFLTFFLIGIWHGQTSVFVVFGLLQGLGVSGNKLFQIAITQQLGSQRYRALGTHPVYEALARGLTFSWFTFSLFCFWSNWEQIGRITTTLGGGAIAVMWIVIIVASSIVLSIYEALRKRALLISWRDQSIVESRYFRMMTGTCLATASLITGALLNLPAPEIIYKAF